MKSQKIKAVKKRMGQVWVEDLVVPVTYLVIKDKTSNTFISGERVKITGNSKGRGFAGVVKRHGFAGGPKTHGQSDRWRHPGSMGQTTTPGRVYKGKRMAGHMGNEKVSLRTSVFELQADSNTLIVKGPVPGSVGCGVIIEKI